MKEEEWIDDIVDPRLNDFLTAMVERDGLLKEIEESAKKRFIPIIHPQLGMLLHILVTIFRPSRILEVGTAIGYSTIWMARALPLGGMITTIEIDRERISEARENLTRAGLLDRVELLHGDALKLIDKIEGTYDVIFLDAAKGQYGRFYEAARRLLANRGLVIADNVLYRGLVYPDIEVKHKRRTMVNRMREFLKMISEDVRFKTVVLPIADGVSISLMKGEVIE